MPRDAEARFFYSYCVYMLKFACILILLLIMLSLCFGVEIFFLLVFFSHWLLYFCADYDLRWKYYVLSLSFKEFYMIVWIIVLLLGEVGSKRLSMTLF